MSNSFIENVNMLAANLPTNVSATLADLADVDLTKVDKVTGKGLSSNDYTGLEKTKLSNIAEGANNYTHPTKHPATIIDGAANPSKILKTDALGNVGFGDVSWSEVGGKPSAFTPITHSHGDGDITGLEYSKIANKPSVFPPSSHSHGDADLSAIDYSKITNKPLSFPASSHAHAEYEVKSNKDIGGGYAGIGANGKISSALLPDLNVSEVFPNVPSEAGMLALGAGLGDIAVRSDLLDIAWICINIPSNVIGNWRQLNSTGQVTSVNGYVGAVNLNKADVGLDNIDNTSDSLKPISNATQTALDLKAPTSHVGSRGNAHTNATTTEAGFMAAADKTKLDGIAASAEVNQNAFSNIAVSGQTTVAADSKTDTLTIIAGTNVSITTDATNDTITINANDTAVGWSEITSKPTTVSGFGLTDVYTKTEIDTKTTTVSTTTIGTIGAYGFGVGIAPEPLVASFGLYPMSGYDDYLSDNYGNYIDATGSVMVFVPKFYYKITNDITSPFNGTKVEVSNTATAGFVIHRAFVNNGVIQDGFFFDKYICGKQNSKFVSKRNIDPCSTHTAKNPILGITGVTANTNDKIFQAVKSRGANYAVPTMFMYNALALISLAHAQSATVATAAWMDISPFTPKGCNNSALKDVNDASIVYVTAGNVTYPASPLNASVSDSVFAKITHNGQKCGITDLNGNMWEVASGFVQSTADVFHILKESVDIKTLTGLVVTDATDNWNTANYDALTLPFTPDETSVTFGNGTSAVFSGSVDTASNDYRLDMCGVPLSTGGAPARFGGDSLWKYSLASMCPIVGGYWSSSSSAGVWARTWNRSRTHSDTIVGGRACLLGA